MDGSTGRTWITRLIGLGALGVVLLALATGSIPGHTEDAIPPGLAAADKLYEEKSYASALKAYDQLLAAKQVPEPRRDEVAYRRVVSMGKAKLWDQALAEGVEFVHTHRGTVWEPRGLYWLGRLYLGVPHGGYRLKLEAPQSQGADEKEAPDLVKRAQNDTPGFRIYRGEDVPKVTGSAKPERVELAEQDFRNSQDALEAARVYFSNFRSAAHTEAEEIQLNFDLARLLQQGGDLYLWASKQKWTPPTAPEWKIDPAAQYSPEWALPKRVAYLYEQIRMLAGKDQHPAALALFGKALWLPTYHQVMSNYAVRYEDGKQIRIPYPYQDEKAEEPLRRLVREYPNDPLREQAQFTLGNYLRQQGEVVEALAEYRRLIRDRPESKWAQDAGAAIQEIRHREISLSPNGGERMPRKPAFQLSYRNVERVRFTVYKLDLDRVFQRKFAGDNWTGFQQLLGDLKAASQWYGPQVASWRVNTKRTKPYQGGSQTITPPVEKIGAYVLEANADGVRTATLFTVTDLALVQKVSREEVHFFAAQLQSGAPEPGVTVLAQQWWWDGNHQQHRTVTGTTDAQGLLSVSLPYAPNRYNITTAALAWRENRYALTSPASSYQSGDNTGAVKVYSQTDRAVYRPMQTVSYRQVVLRRGTREQPGDLKPLAGRDVQVAVYDPRGTVIHRKRATTGEFGSISGEFSLPEGAPLGEYGVNVTVPEEANAPMVAGGNRFRVEEYKKPEFEVTIEPAAERVRLGEKTTAKLSASYYFGGPVPNAKVNYRIYRTYYQQYYHFPRPYDFLYGVDNSGGYQMDFHQGEVVTQGEARTDEKGETKIEFSTDAKGSRWGDNDLSYTVEADVQDASRRVITGTGSVKATKHDVVIFLDFPRGYATRGEEVKVEILTLNPSNKPVSVPGTARVVAYPETPDAKERVVHEEPLKTDAYGRAYLRWTATTGGRFRMEFVARDTAEQEVKGTTELWVQGPELARGQFQFREVFLKLQDLYYEEGQQAKALLVTPGPGCTVLLTREVNNEVLEKQVLTVPGRSLELSLPITRRDVPNVHLSAILIRDGQMFITQEELFVPSKRQFITVAVEADKSQYQPGEKAALKLTARDWQGKPLRTELSVAVTDASLDYIQKGYSPDVRVFFYGDRRPNAVQSGGSTATYFNSVTESTQPRKEFKTHEWTTPDGMGQIPDWPGDIPGYPMYGRYNNYFGMQYRGVMLGGRFAGGGMGGGGMMPGAQMGGASLEGLQASRFDSSLSLAEAAPPVAGMAKDDYARQMQQKPAGSGRSNPFQPNSELRKFKAGMPDDGLAEAQTRTNFSDTAFWTPAVVTGADGAATVQVTWPDNLTEWHASAVGITAGAQVGAGETDVRIRKDLLVRLQAPRFFVERDRVLLTANVHNYLPQAARVQVKLDLGGDAVELMPTLADATGGKGLSLPSAPAESWIDVPKDGEKRVDWSIRVQREGMLKVKMTARSQSAADATELSFPVLVHGVERALAQTGVLRDAHGRAQVKVELPMARKPGSSELVVQLNPSLAGVMLDALPYLIDYPYGCIEQTMSRFLPAVVVTKTLKDSGYNLEALQRRARELEEQERKQPRGPDGVQANSPYTYPKGRPGSLAHIRMLDAKRWRSPVFNSVELHQIITEGLGRVQRFQRPDGGWGWWPDDTSDPYMSAYVLYGLLLARDAGYQADAGVLDRGLNFLRMQFKEDENLHRMAYSVRVLSLDPASRDLIRPFATGRLWDRRERLSAFSKALLAQALHDLGEKEKAETLLRNIETTARLDAANGTLNWDETDGGWWRWWNNKVETNAAVLQAYLAIRPNSEQPGMLVKWLVNNRRGGYWASTRETAMAVYALAEYARVTKELAPEYTATVDLGGRVSRTYSVTRENALFFDNQFVVPDELLETGANTLTLTKEGPGALYYGAYTRYFSLEEPIRATGNEIFVQRRYFRLVPGTATSPPVAKPLDPSVDERRENPFLTANYALLYATGEQRGYEDLSEGPRYERVALNPGDVVTSGDQIEVELQLESKNDYDYLIFEDLKPAGCEPVELRSGEKYGAGLCSNMELRDQKVAFFLTSMPQGTRTLTYRLRAETPGAFHVLPTNGYAMYAPDIRTLSDEMTLSIRDGD